MFSNLVAIWYTQTTWQNTRFLKISAIFVEKWPSCDFFGIYEVSGLKIAKYREIPKLWISLFFLENCQILPNFSQSIPNLTNFYFFWKYNLLDTHFSCKFSSWEGEEMKEEKEFIKYYKAEFRANEEWSNLPRASLWYQVSNFMLYLVKIDECKMCKREEIRNCKK